MTLSIDETNHVTGSFTEAPGFVNSGTLTGRFVPNYIVFTLRQSNGAGGDGVLQATWNDETGNFVLQGPVLLDGDDRPIDNWLGTKAKFKQVSKLRVKPLPSAEAQSTALADVDIYDGPGGQFNVVGVMTKGAQARPLDHHPDGWCKLENVWQGGDGWVADDHLSGCN
jgi:hypothetical protein